MSDALRFTVYFDGTGNNKDLDTPKGAHTNVARLYEADQAKGTNLARNSGHEPLQYHAHDRSGQSEKVYFDGVGSQADVSLRSLAEGVVAWVARSVSTKRMTPLWHSTISTQTRKSM
ncbi:hypothetical protein ACIPZF_20765 [Pseudomonas sp. NPDC089752]|uniref:hypothetical protein n=1 Tax=Pseudomonas sp. NPDC089752 TaxID=3364472 RepID=UPI00382A88CE